MKRYTAWVVFVAAICAGTYPFVQSRIAAQGRGASDVTPDSALDGTLEVLYEDGYDAPRLRHFLHVGTDRIELDFDGHAPRNLQTGDRVRARGKLRNGKLVLGQPDVTPLAVAALDGSGTGTQLYTTQTLASPNTFGPQTTLVILFNFTDITASTPTITAAQNVTFTQVNNFDLENSFNQTSLTGTTVGRYTISSASTVCNYQTWATQADAAANAAGVSVSSYPRRVYSFPQTSACAWWGMGTIGGGTPANPSRAWINGTVSLRVVSHEMGHNFGLYYARTNTCDSTGCVVDEYGDDHDVMGGGAASITGHFSAYQKERIGWLNYGTSPTIQSVSGPGQYAIEPYEQPWGGLPKAIKILKSSGGGSNTY